MKIFLIGHKYALDIEMQIVALLSLIAMDCNVCRSSFKVAIMTMPWVYLKLLMFSSSYFIAFKDVDCPERGVKTRTMIRGRVL